MPATCYLYVLPLACEDIVKVGISRDPLMRIRAFAPRYYECFDLARSALVAFDGVREARRRETALHRRLRSWNAVQPITVPMRAGGHTEWYRGARGPLLDAIGEDRAAGHRVHAPARAWWRARLREERPLLYEWGSQWLERYPDLSSGMEAWRDFADVVDAWPAMGLKVARALPVPLARRYAHYREAWRITLSA